MNSHAAISQALHLSDLPAGLVPVVPVERGKPEVERQAMGPLRIGVVKMKSLYRIEESAGQLSFEAPESCCALESEYGVGKEVFCYV